MITMEEEPLRYIDEDTEYQSIVDIHETQFKEECSSPLWLEGTTSAFTWLQELNYFLILDCKLENQLLEYDNQGPECGYEKFCLLLTIGALKSLKSLEWIFKSSEGSVDETRKFYPKCVESSKSVYSGDNKLISCNSENPPTDNNDKHKKSSNDNLNTEEIYRRCREVLDEMKSFDADIIYKRMGPAFEHILAATRAQTMYFNGDIASSKEAASNLQPVEEMSPECQAACEGIKARLTLHCYQDVRMALKASSKAVDLDPGCGAWHHYCGYTIRRLRKQFKEKMVQEELDFFKKAAKLDPQPRHLAFLAQAYQEMAENLEKGRNKNPSSLIFNMKMKSADLYQECQKLNNNSALILKMIGNGLMKDEQSDKQMSHKKEILLKSIHIHRNVNTIHELARFYYKFEKNDNKAIECYKKCMGIFGTSDIIRVKLIKDPAYDPQEFIDYWLREAAEWANRDDVFCYIGWYYLSFKNDVEMAAKYFWRVLRFDYKSFKLMEFTSVAFAVTQPVNMIEVLVNEILLLKEKKYPKGNMTYLEQFLQKVLEKHPYLRNMRPEPGKLECIKKRAESNLSYHRNKRYPGYQTNTGRSANSNRYSGNRNSGYPGNRNTVAGRQPTSSWRQERSDTFDTVGRQPASNWRQSRSDAFNAAAGPALKNLLHAPRK